MIGNQQLKQSIEADLEMVQILKKAKTNILNKNKAKDGQR